MLKLLRYLKSYWWQIIILFMTIAVQVWSAIQLPAIMAQIVNEGIVAGNLNYVWNAGLRMVMFAAIAAVGGVVANLIAAITN